MNTYLLLVNGFILPDRVSFISSTISWETSTSYCLSSNSPNKYIYIHLYICICIYAYTKIIYRYICITYTYVIHMSKSPMVFNSVFELWKICSCSSLSVLLPPPLGEFRAEFRGEGSVDPEAVPTVLLEGEFFILTYGLIRGLANGLFFFESKGVFLRLSNGEDRRDQVRKGISWGAAV
jgi:hypothetical protein